MYRQKGEEGIDQSIELKESKKDGIDDTGKWVAIFIHHKGTPRKGKDFGFYCRRWDQILIEKQPPKPNPKCIRNLTPGDAVVISDWTKDFYLENTNQFDNPDVMMLHLEKLDNIKHVGVVRNGRTAKEGQQIPWSEGMAYKDGDILVGYRDIPMDYDMAFADNSTNVSVLQ